MTLVLVIGGTRSGKSARAEDLAQASGLRVRYVATADAADPAMAERVRAHAARRPQGWATVEAGRRLADAFTDAAETCVLVDGLGAWIAGELHRAGAFEHPDGELLEGVRREVLAEVERMIALADAVPVVLVVAEQAGEGVLPADRPSRAWLDMLGEATQRIAARAGRVELVAAGRALTLPGSRQTATTAAIEQLRLHGDRDVRPGDADHAVNVLAGGPPAWLRAELARALEQDAERYPDERGAAAALAALHARSASEIVPTNGAAEALWLIPAALRPALAACVHPGFTEAEAALRAHGVPVVRVLREPEHGFALDPGAVPAEADLVVVGNPASPTGTLDPSSALLALRRPGRVLVVDEAFMDLVPGEPGTLIGESLDDVIVVRSLTKALAIPGLRAGYAVASEPMARRLRDVRPPWSANVLALAALATAASRPDALAAIAERASAEREDLQRRLAGLDGVRTWPSATNFCLIEVADGPAVLAAMSERRIAVRAAVSFPGLGPGHLRITARGPQQNELLVAALAEAVGARSEAVSAR
jgi:histidinol-phosphate/aromatic aminotransferase/cobyric acid decarboxylase-like protein/adenosyl cobinamide kinase/adenosyl cobinamide phosphate guanylyltransferase